MSSSAKTTILVSGLALGISCLQVHADTPLTETPISFSDATGETATMIETGPCPFVSDEAILASVRTDFDITRQEVSNTACRWSYNAGFTIDISIEDLEGARPVSERRLNFDVDPVLVPQDGPGSNATVLNDTAWDTPVPYAYSFEQDGKLVFMRYFGFKTDADIMRPAADELALTMGSAPDIAPQWRELAVTFTPCDVWVEGDIRTAFDLGEEVVIAPGASGVSNCAWSVFDDNASGQRTVAFNIFKPNGDEKQEYEYDSYVPFSEDGETHYLRQAPSDFGLYIHIITPRPEGIVHVTVSDPSDDPTAVAKTLHQNLLGRMTP